MALKILEDTDKICFGKHVGKQLIDVPADYLLWLWEQPWFQKTSYKHESEVRAYIKDNLQVLTKQSKK